MTTAVGLLAVLLGVLLDLGAYRNQNPVGLVRHALGAPGGIGKIDRDPARCNTTQENTDPGPVPDQDPAYPGYQGPDSGTVAYRPPVRLTIPRVRRAALPGVPITNSRWT